MRKKKDGATLIVVIIIFMFITVVSVAMLSLAAGNYVARASESKRIENLYASESGLDGAYNIMVKTFNAAAQYGNYSVEAMKKSDSRIKNYDNVNKYIAIQNDKKQLEDKIKEDEEKISNLDSKDSNYKSNLNNLRKEIAKCKELIKEDEEAFVILENEEFKRAFKAFIGNKDEKYGADLNRLIECVNSKKIIYGVKGIDEDTDFQYAKVDFPNKATGKIKDEDSKEKEVELPYLSAKINLKNTTEAGKQKKKELKKSDGHRENITINIIENDIYTITLKSQFKSVASNTKKLGENLKIIQAIYTMGVPEYNEIFYGKANDKSEKYPILDDKSIMVGKDMNISAGKDASSGFTVDGDIFVEGNDSGSGLDNKYKGGIMLNDSNIKFDGEVATRGTFNIKSDVRGSLSKKLYAKNLFVGDLQGGILSAKDNEISFKDIILDNDLTLKANNSKLIMENFFGINDKNTKSSDSSTVGKERTSSSIIVNSPKDTSEIKINHDAYIMGVANIDTENGYQTGESTAVKGNYVAYSVPLDSKEVFEYDDPLQLLKEDDVFKKAKHFTEYWNKVSSGDMSNDTDKRGSINDGGIVFAGGPNSIYSIGAVVYKNGANDVYWKEGDYNLETSSLIKNVQKDYASKVYKMGKKADLDDYDSLGEGADKVEDLVNFLDISTDKSSEYYYDIKEAVNAGDNMLIVNTSDNPLEIEDNQIKLEGKTYTIGSTINAVIVSNGDVNLKGNITIKGNIITCGNLNVNSGKVTLKHDKDVIKAVQLDNEKIYSHLFGSLQEEEKDSKEEESTVKVDKDEDKVAQYDISKFLQSKLWKLVK